MCLGGNKMRIHAPGFGCTIKACICEKRPKDQNLHIQVNTQ
jgi:hypothetical protein